MKLIAIGDIHGHAEWKMIVTQNDADKIIFIGDYFDSRDGISAEMQIENFNELINFKKANMNKVILLLGNHDFHYLRSSAEKYTGFQAFHKFDIQEVLQAAVDAELIQLCFVHENFLFVHAGITKTWCAANAIDPRTIERSVNELFRYKPNSFSFTPGKNHDLAGDEICQSPIWIRPKSLLEDRIENFIQVAGHTAQFNLKISDDVILIDTLSLSGEYLEIVNGKCFVRKIKKSN